MTIDAARAYVGTTPLSGVAQFGVLALRAELRPGSHVVEYGCGALHLARVLVPYLAPGGYVGVDPNRWLQDAALEADPELRRVFRERHAQILTRSDFDVAHADLDPRLGWADVVFAHSVLSHCAAWQARLLFNQAWRVLRPGGVLIASFREGADTNDTEWQYPGVVRFSWDAIVDLADGFGFGAVFEGAAARAFYTAACPDEIHDWFSTYKRTDGS